MKFAKIDTEITVKIPQTTMDKLNEAYNKATGSGGSTTSVSLNSTIYNLSWTTWKSSMVNAGLNKTASDAGKVILTDLATGKSFKVHVQSTGNHADVEPLTAAELVMPKKLL